MVPEPINHENRILSVLKSDEPFRAMSRVMHGMTLPEKKIFISDIHLGLIETINTAADFAAEMSDYCKEHEDELL